MKQMQRVLVPIDSHDEQAWQAAIIYANQICELSAGSVQNVVLLLHTKRLLKGTDLSHFIGDAHSKILDSGGALSLPSGAKLRCETLRTCSTVLSRAVVIAYWADMTMLDFVDGLRHLAGVVAVPEFPGGVDAWATRWAPVVNGPKTPSAPLIADPVVEKALVSIDIVVNRSTGIGHPRDKKLAADVFKILRNKGHQADPELIKSWAIKHGWESGNAAELASLAGKTLSQKTKPSLAGVHNAEDRYLRWQTAA